MTPLNFDAGYQFREQAFFQIRATFGEYVLMDRCRFYECEIVLRDRISLMNCEFVRCTLSASPRLDQASFSGGVFANCTFDEAATRFLASEKQKP